MKKILLFTFALFVCSNIQLSAQVKTETVRKFNVVRSLNKTTDPEKEEAYYTYREPNFNYPTAANSVMLLGELNSAKKNIAILIALIDENKDTPKQVMISESITIENIPYIIHLENGNMLMSIAENQKIGINADEIIFTRAKLIALQKALEKEN